MENAMLFISFAVTVFVFGGFSYLLNLRYIPPGGGAMSRILTASAAAVLGAFGWIYCVFVLIP